MRRSLTKNREPLKLVRGSRDDHRGYDEVTEIAFAEAQGGRPSNEDAYAYGEAPTARDLTPELMQKALVKTVTHLQETCGRAAYTGSTLITAVIVGNQVYIANVGDSVAYLVTADARGNTSLKRLNDLHTPHNPRELARIKKHLFANLGKASAQRIFNEISESKRLPGLAVSRAIGDTNDTSDGLSQSPDVTRYTIDVNHSEGERAFLILGCDGLEDYIEADSLASVRAAYGRTDAEKQAAVCSVVERVLMAHREGKVIKSITKALIESATGRNNYDNVTVMVTEITDDENTKYMSVFDGHGGDSVAKALERDFDTTFTDAVSDIRALKRLVISPDTELKTMKAKLVEGSIQLELLNPYQIIGDLITRQFIKDQKDIAAPAESTVYPPECKTELGCPSDRQIPIMIPESRLTLTRHSTAEGDLADYLKQDGNDNKNQQRLIAIPLTITGDDDYVNLMLYIDEWGQLSSVALMDTKERSERKAHTIISDIFRHIKIEYPDFERGINQYASRAKDDTPMPTKISKQLSHLLHRAYFVGSYTHIIPTATHKPSDSHEEDDSKCLLM